MAKLEQVGGTLEAVDTDTKRLRLRLGSGLEAEYPYELSLTEEGFLEYVGTRVSLVVSDGVVKKLS